jgi:hypothetical protein
LKAAIASGETGSAVIRNWRPEMRLTRPKAIFATNAFGLATGQNWYRSGSPERNNALDPVMPDSWARSFNHEAVAPRAVIALDDPAGGLKKIAKEKTKIAKKG